MNKFFIFIAFFFSSIFIVIGQSVPKARIDSFIQATKNLKSSEKFEALIEISDACLSDSIEASRMYAEEAYKIAKKSDKSKNISDALHALGKVNYEEGNYDECFKYYNEALKIRKDIKDNSGISEIINNIGLVHYTKGEYDEAIKRFNESLEYEYKSKDKKNISSRLNAIGISHKKLGQYDKAVKYYEEALKIDEELENESNLAIDYNNIGAVYKTWGKYDKAIEYYEKAFEIDKKQNKKNDIAIDLNNIGMVYFSKGEYAKAIENYQEAINILKETGNYSSLSNFLNNIGSVYDTWGQYDKALNYYQQALENDQKLNREVDIAIDLNNIGYVYFMLERYDTAAINYEKAITIFREMGAESSVAVLLTNLGEVYKKWGQYEKAITVFEEALNIDKKLNREAEIAADLNIIGSLHLEQKKYNLALQYFKEALVISTKIGANSTLMNVVENLSTTYDAMGNVPYAYKYYKRYTSLKDSIFNEEKHKQFAEFQTKYETQEKEAELKIKNAEIEKKNIENKRQKAVTNFVILVLALVTGLIFIVFRSLQQKKRDNKIIEAEKAKSEELLLNTLPLKVVNDLKETGTTEPEGFENVTVYFSDIVGFTNISTTLEPKVLIKELNDIFTAFDDIMTKYGCERLKTIGDAYLAVCGMPTPNENHAENMVCAAMEILEYMTKRKESSGIDWRIRVGIHSGKVVGGIVGVRKYIYDVFGDTINTASRMESNGSPMRINVSEYTYQILIDKFKFTKREPLEIKGKGTMQMYFVDDKVDAVIN